MARKLRGVEAPRNSLDVQVENRRFRGLRVLGHQQVEQEWTDGSCDPTKRLVNGDDMYTRSRNIKEGGAPTPSIVARLMGVDALPPLLHPTSWSLEQEKTSSRKDQLLDHFYPRTEYEEDSSDQWCNIQTIRRQHPQEEQLDKFKREFEAWQASRFKQCSSVAQIVANIAGQLEHKEEDSTVSSTFGKRFIDGGCTPNKIVILKPGPDDCQDSLATSTSSPATTTSEDRGTASIHNFLEEVKQRLKTQLEGTNFQRDQMLSEYPSKPSVSSWDTNANLVRSESTRSSRRDQMQYNGTEFMNRNARRFLSERLRNIIVRKRTSSLDVRSSSGSDDITMEEMQTRSFRHEEEEEDFVGGIMSYKEPSPRNLMRSLSAPVSFGKLLLEDRHILTGAHIRRKHEEALDTVSEDQLKNGRKERFNIKQKVSSFRHNLSLRGKKMFRKRFQRVESCNYGKDIHIVNNTTRHMPTVVNIGERHRTIMENLTEVPPSPASICSSAQEDLWRPSDYYVSPVSTPDVTLEDESGMPQVFRDICTNLKELRRQINRLGTTDDEEEETGAASSVDCGVEHREEENVRLDPSGRRIEEKAEACYIRELLIVSGLFDGSSSSTDVSVPSSRWDPLGKPIPNWVFEQMEEASRKKWDEEGKDGAETRSDMDRKMLYDLLNEALTTVIPGGRSTSTRTSLRGTKLLERVWKMVQEYVVCDVIPYGSDVSVVERQMGSITSWSCGGLNYEDQGLDELATEMQFLIVEDIIQDTLKELI